MCNYYPLNRKIRRPITSLFYKFSSMGVDAGNRNQVMSNNLSTQFTPTRPVKVSIPSLQPKSLL